MMDASNDLRGRKLIILGLAYEVTDAEFQEFFAVFPGLVDAVIVRDGYSGHSRGFGFVTFSSPEQAQAVLAENDQGGLTIKGKRVDPKLALPKGEAPAGRSAAAAFGGGGFSTTRLFVGRLPFQVTVDDLRRYFEQFGPVVDCYIPLNFGTKQPRGIGFITFESGAAVEAVMQQQHELGGATIAVDRAAPKVEEGGMGFGFGGRWPGRPAGPYGGPSFYPGPRGAPAWGPYGGGSYGAPPPAYGGKGGGYGAPALAYGGKGGGYGAPVPAYGGKGGGYGAPFGGPYRANGAGPAPFQRPRPPMYQPYGR
jgi:heterogeneous nuclear ribonucleoprotein A1/A3